MVEAAAAAPVAEILVEEILAAGTAVAETPAHLAMAEPQAAEIMAATKMEETVVTAETPERPAMVEVMAAEITVVTTAAVVAEEAMAAEVEKAGTAAMVVAMAWVGMMAVAWARLKPQQSLARLQPNWRT